MKKLKTFALLALSLFCVTSMHSLNSHAEEVDKELYRISSAYWDIDDINSRVVAAWDEPETRSSYKIQLYKGTAKIDSLLSSSKEKYDFTRKVAENGTGNYSYDVYVSRAGKEYGVRSETFEVDSEFLTELKKKNNLTNVKKKNGSKKKKKNNSNRKVLTQNIDTKNSGPGAKKLTGWNKDANNRWYWVSMDNSIARSSWIQDNSKWYYLGEDTFMKTGWVLHGTDWYYLSPQSGEMMINSWVLVNDKYYYLGADGIMMKNTDIKDIHQDIYYHLGEDGAWDGMYKLLPPATPV